MKKYLYAITFLLLSVGVIFITDIVKSGSSVEAAMNRGFQKVSAKFAAPPEPTVFLKVPFYRQEHSLSCEAATLKMLLAFHGVTVTEQELTQKVGFDPTPKQNGIWGDPQKGFVGNIDGKMLIDGYGVHNKPIARVANQYRNALAKTGASLEDLMNELEDGKPVIIWSYLSTGKPFRWKTVDGEVINAVYGEHTKVLQGFSGDALNPTGFFLVDPIYGAVYETKEQFLKHWTALDNQMVMMD